MSTQVEHNARNVDTDLFALCLAYISRLKPTKVFVWQYNNKRQKLRYRVHYATKVFDARTLHDSTKVLVHSDPSVVVVANYEHAARSCG